MDSQLEELIEKIKNEGVGKAEAEAQTILAKAQKEAAAILAEAGAKANQLVGQAQAEAARLEATGRDALKQASRDMILALEKKLLSLFQASLREGVDAALAPKLVESLVVELAKAWVAKGESGVQVVLSSADAKKLGEALRTSLAKNFKGGFEVIPSERFSKGVRVMGTGSSLTLDMSSGALADLLGEALQPGLAEILREAVR